MRLNAYLARAGVASRRGADELIKASRVKINGQTGQLNSEVSETDNVELDGKQVKLQTFRYILLNKPTRTVTTLNDPHGRKTVISLLKITERVVPVGRLDYDTTGVLLLTNDGDLAYKLMHPSFEVEKVYEAEVEGEITPEKLRRLEQGVDLEDGKTAPAKVNQIGENKVELSVHEGRKHQIKRMLTAVDLKVVKLHRSRYAGLKVEDLSPGKWREITDEEINKLKMIQ